ncbi:MAG: cell division protein FtsA [Candidatus Omnitrophica bacterium]|nr:cell division protein FtsA [Candidatus Omnitrophota bacterium]
MIPDTAVSLDIGSSKTVVCVGRSDAQGRTAIEHVSLLKTRGVSRGQVVNFVELAGCIEEALSAAEKTYAALPDAGAAGSRGRISSVHLSLCGADFVGSNSKGAISLSARPAAITQRDVCRVVDGAIVLAGSLEREMVHVFPREYIIDGSKRVHDPVGMCGTRLGVQVHVISAGEAAVQTFVKAVNRAGYDVEGVVFSGLATGLVTLSEREKEAGVLLLECGAAHINIVFFCERTIHYMNVVPCGGEDITQALMQEFSIDHSQAEELKIRYQAVPARAAAEDEKIIIKKNTGQYQSISLEQVNRTADRALQAVTEALRRELTLSGILARIPGGVVLAGGMCFMDGISDRMEAALGVPVRLGMLRGVIGNNSRLYSMLYAAGIGTVRYALDARRRPAEAVPLRKGFFGQVLSQMRYVYDQYF